jgi:hypothetical protein
MGLGAAGIISGIVFLFFVGLFVSAVLIVARRWWMSRRAPVESEESTSTPSAP